MKKFLLLLFCWLSIPVISAQTYDSDEYIEIYLRGSMTDNFAALDSYKFNRTGDTYSLTLDTLDGSFKIADSGWSVVNHTYTANTISTDGTYTFVSAHDNSKASGLKNVTISFTFNKENPKANLNVTFKQESDEGSEGEGGEGEGGGNEGGEQQPSGYHVYFDNTSGWTPYVWAWNETENCTAAGKWPGDPMSLKDGKYYWEAPAGKAPTHIVFNNNGGAQTDDLAFVNGATFKPDGSHTGGSEVVIPPVSALEPTGTLPVLYINVYTDATHSDLQNEIIDKDLSHKKYFSDAEYWLDVNGCDWLMELGAASVGSEEAPLPLEIKARGNFTRKGYSKKPYKLKLEKKQNLLNINANGSTSKHWAILAHADDEFGYMRNFVGFRLGEMIGLPWTPRQQPIEVVINGDYRGIYFLTESIRVGDGRLPITELGDNVSDPALISGGYLVELDNYIDDCTFALADASNSNQYPIEGTNNKYSDLMVTADTPEQLSDLQLRFLKDQFTKMNDLVNSNDDSELWSYMDLDDAARYYVVEELISHYEAYHGSTYLFRDHGEGQKWRFSPLWDCGHAFDGSTSGFFADDAQYGNNWIGNYGNSRGLRSKEKFMNKVKDTFQWFVNKEVDGSASPYERLLVEIDDYVAHIKAAALQDAKRWKGVAKPVQVGNDVPRDVIDNSDIEDDKTKVKNHLDEKINWLKGQWGSAALEEPAPDTTPAAELPEYAQAGYEPKTFNIYVIDDAKWGNVNMYLYLKGGSNYATWPGKELEFDKNLKVNGVQGVYTFEVTEEWANGLVIFSNAGNNQYPGANQDGLAIGGKNMVFYTSDKENRWAEPESVEYPWSATLPLVRINTPQNTEIGYGDGGAVKKSTFEIDALGLQGVTAIDAAAAGSVTIKGRGKSYWDNYDKKAYKLKFKNPVAVLDMPKSKHWVLMPYANDAANGLLSNYAGHELSRLIGMEWTASMKPVEVVINDEYMGLYFIAENVRAAAERVQIADYGDATYSEADDFLLEFGSAQEDSMTELFYSWTSDNGYENKLITSTPAKEDILTEEELTRIREYLAGHIDDLRNAVAGAKARPMSADWTQVIDHEQAAKYYVVQELMDDAKSFTDNFYMHHTTGSRWIMGPVWDFGNAFTSKGNKTALIHEGNNFGGTFIDELYANRNFVWFVGYTFVQFVTGESPRQNTIRTYSANASVQDSYNPTMNGTYEEVFGSIDNMVHTIDGAVEKDAVRWPRYAATSEGNSLAQRAETVKNNLRQSNQFLSTSTTDGGAGWNWNEITTGVDDVAIDNNNAEKEYFDVTGRRVINPQAGSVYIVRQGDKVSKTLVK
ncbi:MAG: CotH kinase family protein [Muribaculaceae bacterium]|nr:CotH kinase family protein [Muribaculaceae bacterium]